MLFYYLVLLMVYVQFSKLRREYCVGLCIAQETPGVKDEIVNLDSAPRNKCSASEWLCADGSCIHVEGLCNAAIDCRDASDEYLDTCVGTVRPFLRLQMLCFALAGKSKRICPRICYDQPAFCTYAILAENGYPNTCRFPPYPTNGHYTVQRLANQQDGFRLDYTCDQSFVLVESDELQCINGVWVNEDKPRYCKETCPLHRAENFTYTCKDGLCNDHVPVGTVVAVSRKYFEKHEKPVSARILCQEGRTFNISTRCVDEVDGLQKEFEQPKLTRMIDYETKFNEFNANENSLEFQLLVDEFHHFENDVRDTLSIMHRKYEECDIVLDLLLRNLMISSREKLV